MVEANPGSRLAGKPVWLLRCCERRAIPVQVKLSLLKRAVVHG